MNIYLYQILIILSIILIGVAVLRYKEIGRSFFKNIRRKSVNSIEIKEEKEKNPIDEYQKIQMDINKHDEKIESDIVDSLIFDYPKFEKYINDDVAKNVKDIDFWCLDDKGYSEFMITKKQITRQDTKTLTIHVRTGSFSTDPESVKSSFQIKLNSKPMSSDGIKNIVQKYYYCYILKFKKKEREEQIAKSSSIYEVLKQSQRDSLLSNLLK